MPDATGDHSHRHARRQLLRRTPRLPFPVPGQIMVPVGTFVSPAAEQSQQEGRVEISLSRSVRSLEDKRSVLEFCPGDQRMVTPHEDGSVEYRNLEVARAGLLLVARDNGNPCPDHGRFKLSVDEKPVSRVEQMLLSVAVLAEEMYTVEFPDGGRDNCLSRSSCSSPATLGVTSSSPDRVSTTPSSSSVP